MGNKLDIELDIKDNGLNNINQKLKELKKEVDNVNKTEVNVRMNQTNQAIRNLCDLFAQWGDKVDELKKKKEALGNTNKVVCQNIEKQINLITSSLKKYYEELKNAGIMSKNALAMINQAQNGYLETQISNKQKEDKINEDRKKQAEQRASQLEKLIEKETKIYQENYRNRKKSEDEYQKGKKETASEILYNYQQEQNALKNIKKYLKELNTIDKERANRAEVKKDNQINFTKLNEEQRRLRDEISTTEPILNNLKKTMDEIVDREGKETENAKKAITAYKQLEEIQNERLKKLDEYDKKIKEQAQSGSGGINAKKYDYGDIQRRLEEERKIVDIKQKSNSLNQQSKVSEKEIYDLVNQKYKIEKEIQKLSSDNKGRFTHSAQAQHKNEIALLEQEKKEISNQIKLKTESYTKDAKIVKEIEKKAQAENEASERTKAHNKDLQNQNEILGKTIKNFLKFTVYYQSLRLISKGMRDLVETTKELDAAFTGIRIVTQDTVENTNKLALEYNNLAKELGATTVQVAEGAGEWLRQR